MGHSAAKPASALLALGNPQQPETIYRCFNCHATNVKPGPDLSGMTPGVQCARCHGPGLAAHLANPSIKANIRRDASVAACAECHRMPGSLEDGAKPEASDPLSVRFAPVGLMASRCYQQSKPQLTCVTCHDPHQGKSSAGASAKCQGCHNTLPAGHKTRQGTCESCHMPKSTPLPGLTFTDHRIRP